MVLPYLSLAILVIDHLMLNLEIFNKWNLSFKCVKNEKNNWFLWWKLIWFCSLFLFLNSLPQYLHFWGSSWVCILSTCFFRFPCTTNMITEKLRDMDSLEWSVQNAMLVQVLYFSSTLIALWMMLYEKYLNSWKLVANQRHKTGTIVQLSNTTYCCICIHIQSEWNN